MYLIRYLSRQVQQFGNEWNLIADCQHSQMTFRSADDIPPSLHHYRIVLPDVNRPYCTAEKEPPP
ncbi:hypothetical protein T11_11109 [Trichinella zimbabwensis]|uniref:Uncharacterized protein n=1 Tax=Trichinella zimbabwensis TaxID=268475 RepID=A0A0V1HS23_9BILA|nr:hypothetical protein T11_11109 [Trichinella zimbabwensis]